LGPCDVNAEVLKKHRGELSGRFAELKKVSEFLKEVATI